MFAVFAQVVDKFADQKTHQPGVDAEDLLQYACEEILPAGLYNPIKGSEAIAYDSQRYASLFFPPEADVTITITMEHASNIATNTAERRVNMVAALREIFPEFSFDVQVKFIVHDGKLRSPKEMTMEAALERYRKRTINLALENSVR